MTEEELRQKEASLQKMEEDIQKKCSDIDKREKELGERLGLEADTDLSLKFYELVNNLCVLWHANKGTPDGMLDAITKIIEVRRSMRP